MKIVAIAISKTDGNLLCGVIGTNSCVDDLIFFRCIATVVSIIRFFVRVLDINSSVAFRAFALLDSWQPDLNDRRMRRAVVPGKQKRILVLSFLISLTPAPYILLNALFCFADSWLSGFLPDISKSLKVSSVSRSKWYASITLIASSYFSCENVNRCLWVIQSSIVTNNYVRLLDRKIFAGSGRVCNLVEFHPCLLLSSIAYAPACLRADAGVCRPLNSGPTNYYKYWDNTAVSWLASIYLRREVCPSSNSAAYGRSRTNAWEDRMDRQKWIF